VPLRLGEPGPDAGELAVFVAGALLLRVDRLLARRPAKRERKVERLLDHCERELAGEGRRRG
jgi:hypothetical protein